MKEPLAVSMVAKKNGLLDRFRENLLFRCVHIASELPALFFLRGKMEWAYMP